MCTSRLSRLASAVVPALLAIGVFAPSATGWPGAVRVGPHSSPGEPIALEGLRIWAGGDSLAIFMARSVAEVAGSRGAHVCQRGVGSSGLTRPDYLDWPSALRADLRACRSDAVIYAIGANDAQAMYRLPGERFGTASWQTEYRNRVRRILRVVDGRRMVWVGLPVVSSSRLNASYRLINRLVRQELALSAAPNVWYLDTYAMLSDHGGYSGRMRAGDGIHYGRDGGLLIARTALSLIRQPLTASRLASDRVVGHAAPIRGHSALPRKPMHVV